MSVILSLSLSLSFALSFSLYIYKIYSDIGDGVENRSWNFHIVVIKLFLFSKLLAYFFKTFFFDNNINYVY